MAPSAVHTPKRTMDEESLLISCHHFDNESLFCYHVTMSYVRICMLVTTASRLKQQCALLNSSLFFASLSPYQHTTSTNNLKNKNSPFFVLFTLVNVRLGDTSAGIHAQELTQASRQRVLLATHTPNTHTHTPNPQTRVSCPLPKITSQPVSLTLAQNKKSVPCPFPAEGKPPLQQLTASCCRLTQPRHSTDSTAVLPWMDSLRIHLPLSLESSLKSTPFILYIQ